MCVQKSETYCKNCTEVLRMKWIVCAIIVLLLKNIREWVKKRKEIQNFDIERM